MTVALYAFTCGHLTLPLGFLLDGRAGTLRVPVPSFLVVHPKGTALFDSGLHLEAQRDPTAHVGDFLASFHTFHFRAGEEIAARLGAADVEPRRVDYVINSHLHFDHAGGNAQVPNAQVVVQRLEWEAAHQEARERKGYVGRDFDTGQPVRQVDGELDVFGDGSVVCIPSRGHTPGRQSLRVRSGRSEYVLCGDACYLKESLEGLHLPGVIADREAARQTLLRFRALQQAGAHLVFGHDPGFWATVPQAPARLG